MDGQSQDTIMHEEYNILGYSYMAFVIKDMIETRDKKAAKHVFDITPFNYLFRKATSLIDSNNIQSSEPSFFKKILEDICVHDKEYLF